MSMNKKLAPEANIESKHTHHAVAATSCRLLDSNKAGRGRSSYDVLCVAQGQQEALRVP